VRTHREEGDTLVELLVTLTVLALAVVSLVNAFGAIIASSARHRELATLDNVLKNFAESATYQIQLQPNPLFVPCATLTATATTPQQVLYGSQVLSYSPPSGFTISATTKYLYQNSMFQTLSSPGQCDQSQYWPQLITATATGPNGASAHLSFVVTDPSVTETYVQPVTTTTTSPTTTTSTTTTTAPRRLHVSRMTGARPGTKQSWDAQVTVYVEDSSGVGVAGVLVSGSWADPISTTTNTCTTNASGYCSVVDGTPGRLSANDKSETFTVSNLSMTGYTYDPTVNSPSSASFTVAQP